MMDADPDQAVRIIASVDPKSAYDLIFEHPNPPAVAKAIPFEDAYLLVKAVGEIDTIDLMEMMDEKKVLGFFDLDCWNKDRISIPELMDWISIIMEFNDTRFMAQISVMDESLKLAILKSFIEVIKIEEPDENPFLETKDVFVTPDNRYALRISGTEDQKRIINELMMRIYRLDLNLFYWVLEGIYWESMSELEEYAYREKTGRLSWKGFPEYYDALEVFTIVDPDKFQPVAKSIKTNPVSDQNESGSMFLAEYEYADSLLRRALPHVGDALEQVQLEIMSLVNMVSIGHRLSFADFQEVGKRVRMVDGYLSLGLEKLAGTDVKIAAAALGRMRLIDVYKVGRSLVIMAARPLKGLIAKISSDGKSLDKTLLEPRLAEFAELMIQRDPELLDANGDRVFFENFNQLEYAGEMAGSLEQIVNLFHNHLKLTHDTLAEISLLGTNQQSRAAILYGTLFCTAFANDMLQKEFAPIPLTIDDCLKLSEMIKNEANVGQLPKDAVEEFFAWAKENDGKIYNASRKYFTSLFEQMASQLISFGSTSRLDPRYVSILIIKTLTQ